MTGVGPSPEAGSEGVTLCWSLRKACRGNELKPPSRFCLATVTMVFAPSVLLLPSPDVSRVTPAGESIRLRHTLL